MRTVTAALIIAALGVTSAFAADVAPAADSATTPSAVEPASPPVRSFKPGGRMPVRGLDHLVLVYGAAARPDADAQPLIAGQDACNLSPRQRI